MGRVSPPRLAEASDDERIVDARRLADPAVPPRSLATWRWWYRTAPHGSRVWIAEERGRVTACIAARVLEVLVEGERARWLQVGEVFHEPRPGLARHLPVHRLAEAFLAAEGGRAPDGHPVLVGFPSRAVFRLSSQRFAADVVRNQNKLCLVPGGLLEEPAPDVEVQEVERFPAQLDDLFARASAALGGAIALRDAATANRRFSTHPERRYRIALARERASGALLGYCVYRPGTYDGAREALFSDWLVDPEAPRAGASLRAWLTERARLDGAPRLSGILSDTCADWRSFQFAGFDVHPTADYLQIRSFQRPYDEKWVHRHWYYTLADFELG